MIGFDLEETPKICAIIPCCQIKEPALVGCQAIRPGATANRLTNAHGMNRSK
jgi:hypothetical protein